MKKLLREKKKTAPQIVVTNLIDIILLLVFFFMITSSFAKNPQKIPLNLPSASNTNTMENENLSIQVGAKGEIYVSGKIITADELNSIVKEYITNAPERPIMLEADKEVNYGIIIAVLDTIRSSGASNIGLATKPLTK